MRIEIDLSKLERGLREGQVKVTRGGKTFYRKQRVGRKEVEGEEKPKKELVIMGLNKPEPEPEDESETSMTSENVESKLSGMEVGLKGSMHEDELFIMKFKDKSSAIYKPMAPPEIIGEVKYYEVSKLFDTDICPETIKIGWGDENFGEGEGSCQKWISDADEPYGKGKGVKIESSHYDDLAKIFVQDMIVGCDDRHIGNVVISKGRCYAIDNEDWGKPGRSDKSMSALDAMCKDVDEPTHDVMLNWMKNSMDESQFKEFRGNVVENIGSMLKKKEAAFEHYNQYLGDEEADVDYRIESVKDNIEALSKYIGTNK